MNKEQTQEAAKAYTRSISGNGNFHLEDDGTSWDSGAFRLYKSFIEGAKWLSQQQSIEPVKPVEDEASKYACHILRERLIGLGHPNITVYDDDYVIRNYPFEWGLIMDGWKYGNPAPVPAVEGETIAGFGRLEDQLYTYYQLDLENINEEWDYTICESLDHIRETLQYLDVHLDDDTETSNGESRRVVITGIPMTPSAYRNFLEENDVPQSQRAKKAQQSKLPVIKWEDVSKRKQSGIAPVRVKSTISETVTYGVGLFGKGGFEMATFLNKTTINKNEPDITIEFLDENTEPKEDVHDINVGDIK